MTISYSFELAIGIFISTGICCLIRYCNNEYIYARYYPHSGYSRILTSLDDDYIDDDGLPEENIRGDFGYQRNSYYNHV